MLSLKSHHLVEMIEMGSIGLANNEDGSGT